MKRRSLLGATLAAAAAPAVAAPSAVADETDTPETLDAMLRPYLARGLPAIAAAVAKDGAVTAAGAVGTRRAGAEIPVTPDDRFHIGSDTKAMTSLLAGMFVEQGKLRWDGTVGESFPELAPQMDAGFRRATLTQLLSHTSGLPGDNAAFGKMLEESFALDAMNLDEMRVWLVRQAGHMPLAHRPGAGFAYSNLGYTIAGAMLERAGGKTWEELVVERIFTPLDLRSAGFGPQASMGRVDAPLGHVVRKDGTLKPMLAGPDGDNPAIIGPAGTVHLSVLDFARWTGWQAMEGKAAPALVSAETMRKMHTPVVQMKIASTQPGTPTTGGYALGWGVASVPYSREPVVTHNGSNTMNLAMAMLQPGHGFAMVLMTNVSGKATDGVLHEAAEAVYRTYGPAVA
ncbi:MAG: beta-lactamase family protein [Proteobacteria bacterium]|nr:beta-lactamase family protein [Pseudomonadota bacterium]